MAIKNALPQGARQQRRIEAERLDDARDLVNPSWAVGAGVSGIVRNPMISTADRRQRHDSTMI